MTRKHLALVGKVERGQGDRFTPQIHPDVHLGKIGQRKNAEVLARVVPAVEEVPQLRTLVLRVPLAEIVAVGKKALLGAGLLFVAPATAEARGEFVLLNRVEQGHRLQRIARSVGAFLLLDPIEEEPSFYKRWWILIDGKRDIVDEHTLIRFTDEAR